MAMNLPTGSSSGDPEVMVDINTTPLIDVMLVLLIMLIITIPVQLHAVNLNLPDDSQPPPPDKPPVAVRIDIEANGTIHWNGETVPGEQVLESRLVQAAAQPEQPELHLYPDRQSPYKYVAKVLAAGQRNGLTKIGIAGQDDLLD
jgi:biopolymer transport protein ExbD